jgi:hypothetical protein
LNTLGELSKVIDISISNNVQFTERFFRGGFLQDNGIDEFEVFLIGHLVCVLRVLSQNISCKIIVTILAVQKKQVDEGFREEWGVLKKEIQLFKGVVSIFLHIHQGLVQQGNRIKLFLGSWRHI